MLIIGDIEIGCTEHPSGPGKRPFAHHPSSAGDVDVRIKFRNDSSKTIKRAYFTVVPYNKMGNAQTCTVKGRSEVALQYSGPLPSGQTRQSEWNAVWCNRAISWAWIKQIDVEYTDGTAEVLTGEAILKKPKSGCYIATAVYGSYDCPQVWTLRRFRDGTLAERFWGRAFIRAYYAVSPALVRWFGDAAWFQRLWRGPLDRLVARLRREGVEDTPYQDREW